jgi:hypothetical protein
MGAMIEQSSAQVCIVCFKERLKKWRLVWKSQLSIQANSRPGPNEPRHKRVQKYISSAILRSYLVRSLFPRFAALRAACSVANLRKKTPERSGTTFGCYFLPLVSFNIGIAKEIVVWGGGSGGSGKLKNLPLEWARFWKFLKKCTFFNL